MGAYDGSTVRLFLDGVEAGSGTATGGLPIVYATSTINSLLIGSFEAPDCNLAFISKPYPPIPGPERHVHRLVLD
jgi:hypothetical protein